MQYMMVSRHAENLDYDPFKTIEALVVSNIKEKGVIVVLYDYSLTSCIVLEVKSTGC